MKKLILWLMKFVSDQDKLIIADRCLKDVQTSKYYAIPNTMAESLMRSIIKSNGNKIVDFIVKD